MQYANFMQFLNCEKILFVANFNTSKISFFNAGGNARIGVFPKSNLELCKIIKALRRLQLPYYIIGKSSNVIFSDYGYAGVVIITKFLDKIEIIEDRLIAECGATLSNCAIFSMSNSLSGMEFLLGIPGSVGGAIYMNSSAYGFEIKDIVENCRIYDVENDKELELSSCDLKFCTKQSIFSNNKKLVLLSAKFKLNFWENGLIKQKMLDMTMKRIDSQPLEQYSLGSAFKRPLNSYASKLIDELSLKGFTIGGAQVSQKHAGFIVNNGQATAGDLRKIIYEIKKKVLEKYNILLEQEIIFVD